MKAQDPGAVQIYLEDAIRPPDTRSHRFRALAGRIQGSQVARAQSDTVAIGLKDRVERLLRTSLD